MPLETPPNIGQIVEDLCKMSGWKLKPLCEAAGVKYSTLHQQISRRSSIPFEVIDAIAHTLGRPLTDFSNYKETSISKQVAADRILDILQMISHEEGENNPKIDDFHKAVQSSGFSLQNLGEIKQYCDIYFPLDGEHTSPHPLKFGEKSPARTILGMSDSTTYYQRLSKMDDKLKAGARQDHERALTEDFFVTTVRIDEIIEGRRVSGLYMRAMARLKSPDSTPKTVLFTQKL